MPYYVSTRGAAGRRRFDDVLLAGLAEDGGLFLPESWPALDLDRLRAFEGKSYAALASEVLFPFFEDALTPAQVAAMADEAYGRFRHPATAPLVQLDRKIWSLELFHGPTLAFKDVALQLLARLFEESLARRSETITILGATSGDTGAAAVEACADRARMRIVMLHPEGRVSAAQRRQMTTNKAENVLNIAVKGDFDDCQRLVKEGFGDEALRRRLRLAAVNSINWARVAAQAVYYVDAALRLGGLERPLTFSTPSGNFGDAYAGYIASSMGLPIEKIVVATNKNDILARFFTAGDYSRKGVTPTTSPAMDIQVASNFERLVYDLLGRDGAAAAAAMADFQKTGVMNLPEDAKAEARRIFRGERVEEDDVRDEIRETYRKSGVVLDPHSAIGVRAARRVAGDGPIVALATAHPAKFPEAVERACGVRPRAAILDAQASLDERCASAPPELGAIVDLIDQRFGDGRPSA